jgi:hypothetical protein
MFATLLTWLGSLLGGPFITAALKAYQAKLATETNKDTLQARLAAQAMEADVKLEQLRVEQRIAQTGTWYAVENVFGYVTLFYYSKVLIWDAALHMGTTDAVRGDVGIWAGLVITYFFGLRAIQRWRMR